MGTLVCFIWPVLLVFWWLLWRGRDELGPRWLLGLVLGWLAVWKLSALIPGGSYFFVSLVALLDILLILVVFGGDIRLT